MSVQVAMVAGMQEAVPVRDVVVSSPPIEALLSDLPSAHRPLPIGSRGAVQGCHGTRQTASTVHSPRFRFVYFPVAEADQRHQAYHQHLVIAETLMGRVLAARTAGLRPIDTVLDHAAEIRAAVRPPQELFHSTTLEYRRWYDTDGAPRAEPLTQEALAVWLVQVSGVPMEEARHRVTHRTHALPAAEQAWLLARRAAAPAQRPLNQAEFQALVQALEGAWRAPTGAPHVERANREIARRVVALLGHLLDTYVAPPFQIAELGHAFGAAHLAHLQQGIETSRRTESAAGVLCVGPKAWFAAKAMRMRAEHQIGLALAPRATDMPRPPAGRAVAVVGGRLWTFMDAWHRDRERQRAALPMSVMRCTAFG